MARKRRRPATPLEVQSRPRTLGEARLVLLHERGFWLSEIARFLGKTEAAVSRVNSGQRRSRTIEREIARRLTLSEEEAFPEWAGRRRRGGG